VKKISVVGGESSSDDDSGGAVIGAIGGIVLLIIIIIVVVVIFIYWFCYRKTKGNYIFTLSLLFSIPVTISNAFVQQILHY